MILSRVAATVVMTVKNENYVGEKLLSVDVLDEKLKPTGQTIVAIDKAQAGVGDLVLVLRDGNGIRQIYGREQGLSIESALKRDDLPVRSLIVAVVDDVVAAK